MKPSSRMPTMIMICNFFSTNSKFHEVHHFLRVINCTPIETLIVTSYFSVSFRLVMLARTNIWRIISKTVVRGGIGFVWWPLYAWFLFLSFLMTQAWDFLSIQVGLNEKSYKTHDLKRPRNHLKKWHFASKVHLFHQKETFQIL